MSAPAKGKRRKAKRNLPKQEEVVKARSRRLKKPDARHCRRDTLKLALCMSASRQTN